MSGSEITLHCCALRTSQYFLRHSERLHRHPMLCPVRGVPTARVTTSTGFPIRGLKAFGFFARVSLMAFSRRSPPAAVFPQSLQLQPSQNRSAAKHSQYSFRHLDFLQLQGLLLDVGDFFLFSFPVDGGTFWAELGFWSDPG
jgi:hypothetical protein